MKDDEIPRNYDQIAEEFSKLVKEARTSGIDVLLVMRESSMFSQATRVSFSRNCDDILAYGLIQFAFETVGACGHLEEE